MDFLDNVSKVLNQTAKKAVKISGDVVDYTKIMVNIRSEQSKIESFYREIGRSIYRKYNTSPSMVPADIGDYCQCITEIHATIAGLRERAAKLRGECTCPNCGSRVGEKFEYCPSCGAKQPKEAPPAEECSGDCGCGEGGCCTSSTCTTEEYAGCDCDGECSCDTPDEQPSNCSPSGMPCCPDEDTCNYEGEHGQKVPANESEAQDECCKDGVCGIKLDEQ